MEKSIQLYESFPKKAKDWLYVSYLVNVIKSFLLWVFTSLWGCHINYTMEGETADVEVCSKIKWADHVLIIRKGSLLTSKLST